MATADRFARHVHRQANRLLRRDPAERRSSPLSISFSGTFADYYSLGEFTSKEHPGVVAQGATVDTLAVPAVLAVYNWPKGSDRYRKVERFVQNLFSKFSKLQPPPFHPKWRDVNLSATVPGWHGGS